jgi:hypothetical protein
MARPESSVLRHSACGVQGTWAPRVVGMAVCIAGGEAGRGEECPAVEDDLRALLNGAATHLDALVDLTAL